MMKAGVFGRILVVDDDRATCDFLVELLRFEGYDVDCVQDATEAWARIIAGGVALVLLDVCLADGSGLQLCEQVRADARFQYVAILAVSASVNDKTAQAVVAAGADAYVQKPFDLDRLLDLVRIHVAPTAAPR